MCRSLLILLRHARADGEDSRLNEEGLKQAHHASQGLATYLGLPSAYARHPKQAIRVNPPCNLIIRHSGTTPAMQTAAAVRDALVVGGMTLRGDAAEPDALSPGADHTAAEKLVDSLLTSAESEEGTESEGTLLVLVAGAPHLHRLAGALGIEGRQDAHFRLAGGLVLEKEADSDSWSHLDTLDHTSIWFGEPPLPLPPPPPPPPLLVAAPLPRSSSLSQPSSPPKLDDDPNTLRRKLGLPPRAGPDAPLRLLPGDAGAHGDARQRPESLDGVATTADDELRSAFSRPLDLGWLASPMDLGWSKLLSEAEAAVGEVEAGGVDAGAAPGGSNEENAKGP